MQRFQTKNEYLAHLQQRISEEGILQDPDIYKKYNVLKFLVPSRGAGEDPVEVWIYPEKFVALPIIENQFKIRADSILSAANVLFNQAGNLEGAALLAEAERKFFAKIAAVFKAPAARRQTDGTFAVDVSIAEAQFKELNDALKELMHEIVFAWGAPFPQLISDEEYKHFYEQLWHEEELADLPHKKNNILAINLATDSFQYYERGIHPQFIPTLPGQDPIATESKERKTAPKRHPSAHNRSAPGISNFIVYWNGHVEDNGDLHVTNVGSRSASLPPIDLYKELKKSEDKEALSIRALTITTQNMQAVWHEMAHSLRDNHLAPTDWINMSLLTVDQPQDKEYQDLQYRDTILAADRLRAMHGERFNPIVFDFGVNRMAVGKGGRTVGAVLSYPKDQHFENQRAFVQLMKVVNTKLCSLPTVDTNGHVNQAKVLFNKFNNLSLVAFPEFRKIEEKINQAAQKFNNACLAYEQASESDRHELAKKLRAAQKALNKEKTDAYRQANAMFATYQAKFTAQEKAIIELLREVEAQNGTSEVYYALEDLTRIHQLFLNHSWRRKENNFDLQARILDLGQALDKLEDPDGRYTSTNFHCKSDNDRSSANGYHLDEIRARRRLLSSPDHKSDSKFDSDTHYLGSAMHHSPILDTNGGGGKFEGHRHPCEDERVRALERATAKLASHKAPKKYFPSLAEFKVLGISEGTKSMTQPGRWLAFRLREIQGAYQSENTLLMTTNAPIIDALVKLAKALEARNTPDAKIFESLSRAINDTMLHKNKLNPEYIAKLNSSPGAHKLHRMLAWTCRTIYEITDQKNRPFYVETLAELKLEPTFLTQPPERVEKSVAKKKQPLFFRNMDEIELKDPPVVANPYKRQP
jgi:hypothetical protein